MASSKIQTSFTVNLVSLCSGGKKIKETNKQTNKDTNKQTHNPNIEINKQANIFGLFTAILVSRRDPRDGGGHRVHPLNRRPLREVHGLHLRHVLQTGQKVGKRNVYKINYKLCIITISFCVLRKPTIITKISFQNEQECDRLTYTQKNG